MRRIFEYHPVYGYRFVPNLKARIQHEGGGYLLKTNSLGFRSFHEFVEKKSKPFRVLVFGDSFTAGDGVSNGKRFTDLIEKSLPDVEVYNFGMPGTGPGQHHLIYQDYFRNIDHDLVVIAPLVENVQRVASRFRYYDDDDGNQICYAKPYYSLEKGKLCLRHVPPQKGPVDETALSNEDAEKVNKVMRFPLLNKVLSKTNTMALAHKIWGRDPYPEYHDSNHSDWQLMKTILKEWIQKSPSRALLIPLPFYVHIEDLHSSEHYHARFKELSVETGCLFHDPISDLKKAPISERRKYRFKVDVHPSALGHKAIADSLIPVIARALGSE